MGKEKDTDCDERFDNRLGGDRVADKERGTVYSPKQIDEMKEKSDEKRDA